MLPDYSLALKLRDVLGLLSLIDRPRNSGGLGLPDGCAEALEFGNRE
jgi:hypothetical protein